MEVTIMDTGTKRVYMKIVQKRYLKANKKEKGKILDEIAQNLEIQRKAANRLVLSELSKPRKIRDPLYLYSAKTIWILEVLWREIDCPSSVLLKAALPDHIKALKKRYPIDPQTEKDLFKISARTIDRRLIKKKKAHLLRLHSTTRPNRPLYNRVPIRTSSLKITKPGSLELDTLAHCGFSNSGHYIHTVNTIDIALCFISRRAVLGKGAIGVRDSLIEIIDEMPFTIHELDSDNGDEFLNKYLIDFCEATGLQYFRSRPYKKNDQAHIEQKNATHVRRLFGRIRLDTPFVCELMNDLYKNELFLYDNFFRPSQKLLSKTFVGSKVIRKFEKTPLSPYRRLLKARSIPKKTKIKLTKLFESLDPLDLKKTIRHKIKRISHAQRNQLHETA